MTKPIIRVGQVSFWRIVLSQLPVAFPQLYKEFEAGDFVVRNTVRKFSCVAMDQALEQNYNKPAKSQSGIIGMTRKKKQ